MATTISVRLERPFLQTLLKVEKKWHTDRSEVIRRLLNRALEEWKKEQALERVREHKISVGKAAEECNIALWEMLELLKEKNIDWTDYSEKDLKKDLERIQ